MSDMLPSSVSMEDVSVLPLGNLTPPRSPPSKDDDRIAHFHSQRSQSDTAVRLRPLTADPKPTPVTAAPANIDDNDDCSTSSSLVQEIENKYYADEDVDEEMFMVRQVLPFGHPPVPSSRFVHSAVQSVQATSGETGC